MKHESGMTLPVPEDEKWLQLPLDLAEDLVGIFLFVYNNVDDWDHSSVIYDSPDFTIRRVWIRNSRVPVWANYHYDSEGLTTVTLRSLVDRPYWKVSFATSIMRASKQHLKQPPVIYPGENLDAFYEDFCQAKLAIL